MAEWLATINLSNSDTWTYELKTLPRVKGRSANVIITEYDLPRKTIEPHDVIVVNGKVYYTNFGEQFLGTLDPKTGKTGEYAMAVVPQGLAGRQSRPRHRQGRQSAHRHDVPGARSPSSIRRPRNSSTGSFRPSALKDDSQLNMITNRADVDGKVWINDAGPSTLFRLDLNTGKFQEIDPMASLPGGRAAGYSIYDVRANSKNNAYVTDFQKNYLVKIDAETLKTTAYQTGSPLTRNRRGRIDEFRTGSSSPSIAATRSRCSTPRPRR